MIVRISGELVTVTENQAWIDVNGITHAVLITKPVGERLIATGKVGEKVTFHTLHYIEGTIGIGNLLPRLVGFLNEVDLEFFSLLITVQGLSVKKALKALVIPAKDFARIIELDDTTALKKLPEIGAKTAQKIIMDLKGKTAKFALLREDELPQISSVSIFADEYQREAIDILLQLQYTPSEAESLIERCSKENPSIKTSEELIQEIFKSQHNKR